MGARRILWVLAAFCGCLAAMSGAISTPPALGSPAPRAMSPISCGSLGLSGAAGSPSQASALLGDVRAELFGTTTTTYGLPGLSGATIRVFVGRRQVLSAPVVLSGEPPGSPLVPGDIGRATAPVPWSFLAPSASPVPLCIARFGGRGADTAVLVAVYSGGAHCCTSLDAYVLRSAGVHAKPLLKDLGNAGVSLIANAGHAVLASEDDVFAYEFASFGFSGMPLLTLEIRGDRFVTTTGLHPGWVAIDAGFQWGRFIQETNMGLGWLAAWAADECTLAGSNEMLSTLDQLETQGFLDAQPPSGWPEGATYVSDLRTFLSAHGYCARR
jgi:hypothetical protein